MRTRKAAPVEVKVARMKAKLEWYEKVGKLRLDVVALENKAKATKDNELAQLASSVAQRVLEITKLGVSTS